MKTTTGRWIAWTCAAMMFGTGLAGSVQAAPPQDLRLYVFDCGRLDSLDAAQFIPGQGLEGQKLSLVNRCYLIQHPQGTLLWETGLPVTAAFSLTRTLIKVLTLGGVNQRIDRPLKDQLTEIGVSPGEIDFLALSHVHDDHAGTANDFRASTWLVQKAELDGVASGANQGVNPLLFATLTDRIVLRGDFDVFGDGRVVILSTPGHTTGHQSLLVDLPKTGPVVLSGDLYHTQRNRDLQVFPVFNANQAQSLRSAQRIEALLLELGATLWIQHDPDSNRGIALSPQFFE